MKTFVAAGILGLFMTAVATPAQGPAPAQQNAPQGTTPRLASGKAVRRPS